MNLNLECKEFETYIVGRGKIYNGVAYKFRFPNRDGSRWEYGASVVKHDFSYGHTEDQWELAVIRYWNRPYSDEFDLCYDTDITNDVIGWLTDQEVCELLGRIKEL